MIHDKEEKLKKLAIFVDNPQLAIFDELETANETLKEMYACQEKGNEMMKMMGEKEMPEPDLSKVEGLLTQLVEKEDKPEDISITLKIV